MVEIVEKFLKNNYTIDVGYIFETDSYNAVHGSDLIKIIDKIFSIDSQQFSEAYIRLFVVNNSSLKFDFNRLFSRCGICNTMDGELYNCEKCGEMMCGWC